MIARVLRVVAFRVVITIFVVFVLTAGTYALYFRLPSDPSHFLFGERPTRSEFAQAHRVMGIDRSVPEQYKDFVQNALHGDLGVAWVGSSIGDDGRLQGAPVARTLVRATTVTGSVVLGGAVVLVLVAVPLALVAAAKPRSWVDRASVIVMLLAVSTHPVVVARALQSGLGIRSHVLPAGGYCYFLHAPQDVRFAGAAGVCQGPGQWAAHLLLPWLTFALFFIALYMRVLRVGVIEALHQPFSTAARARGAPEWRVLAVHALPNAALPVLTMLAMDAGAAIGASIYIESVFGLPGLGDRARESFNGAVAYDLPMIVGIVIVVALIVMTFNTVANALYVAIDPRTRPRRLRAARPTGGLV